jgi:toxin ParE1/3/4
MAEENAELGLKAMEAIEEGTLLLARFPNAGRPAVDLEPEQKELLISFGASGYVLLYEVEGEKVFILALRHQREVGY